MSTVNPMHCAAVPGTGRSSFSLGIHLLETWKGRRADLPYYHVTCHPTVTTTMVTFTFFPHGF
jgi:hypothetical protein